MISDIIIIPKFCPLKASFIRDPNMIIRDCKVMATCGKLVDLKSQSSNGLKSCSNHVRVCVIMIEKQENAFRQKSSVTALFC